VFQLYSPAITAIVQPINKIADATIDLLIKRLKTTTDQPEKIVLKTAMIHRKSSQ